MAAPSSAVPLPRTLRAAFFRRPEMSPPDAAALRRAAVEPLDFPLAVKEPEAVGFLARALGSSCQVLVVDLADDALEDHLTKTSDLPLVLALQGALVRNLGAALAALAARETPLAEARIGARGPAGALVGAFYFTVGTVISGASILPEFLPAFGRELGEHLPTGAGVQAVRDNLYFPDAPIGGHLTVLGLYASIGCLIVLITNILPNRHNRTSEVDLHL